ncbi:hypothetical protein ACMD2_12747, partial [Ananas comosus]
VKRVRSRKGKLRSIGPPPKKTSFSSFVVRPPHLAIV